MEVELTVTSTRTYRVNTEAVGDEFAADLEADGVDLRDTSEVVIQAWQGMGGIADGVMFIPWPMYDDDSYDVR